MLTDMATRLRFVILAWMIALGMAAKAFPDGKAVWFEEQATSMRQMIGVHIQYTHPTLRVTGAEGKVLLLYNVAGVCVKQWRIVSDDQTIVPALPRGCYIIKVDSYVRKIAIP